VGIFGKIFGSSVEVEPLAENAIPHVDESKLVFVPSKNKSETSCRPPADILSAEVLTEPNARSISSAPVFLNERPLACGRSKLSKATDRWVNEVPGVAPVFGRPELQDSWRR